MTYRRGIMAMEENSELSGDLPEEQEMSVEFAESAEVPMIEMNSAEAELEYVNTDIETAADTAETMDKMAEGIEKTIPDGGLSEPAAQAVEAALEHFKATLGFVKTKTIGLEAFHDKTTRVRATMEALDDVKKTIKAIWEGIVAAFQKVIAWVKTFFTHMFDATAKLRKRADDMVSASNGKNILADATVDCSSFGMFLHKGGKLLNADDISSALTGLSETRSQEHVENTKLMDDVVTSVKVVIDSAGKKPGEFKFTTKLKPAKAPKGLTIPDDCVLVSTGSLVGDKERFSILPDIKQNAFKRFVSLYVAKSFVADSADAKPAPTGQVNALSVDDIKVVAMSVIKQMDDLAEMKKALPETLKTLDELVAASKKASAMRDLTPEEAKNIKMAASAARVLLSITTSGQTAFSSFSIKVGKAALDYCGKSLATVKGKAKVEDKEAK